MDIEMLKRMFKDYPPLMDILNKTTLDKEDWKLLISNIKAFQKDDRAGKFEKATHFTEHMTEALEHLVEHGHLLDRQPPQGMSRRDFLRGVAAAGVATALYPIMPREAHAEVIVPKVTPYNYKEFVYSSGNSIIVYTNSGNRSSSEGPLFIDALEKKLQKRVPIYIIDFKGWPNNIIQDWADHDNGKDVVPSYHIIINNVRQIRIRGPPTDEERSALVEKIDKYLKTKGL